MIIAGTGHRPPRLGGYSDGVYNTLIEFAGDMLRQHYRHHLFSSLAPMTVISGLALGWDQALAIAADKLGLTVWGYAPCKNMDVKWPQLSQDKYNEVLGICEKIIYVHDGDYPGPWCMIKRDERMVDDSNEVLALFDGNFVKSGTGHTVKYANKLKRKVTNVWDQWLEYQV